MNIIYIDQWFATRSGATGTRSYEFARLLTGKGRTVTVIRVGSSKREQ